MRVTVRQIKTGREFHYLAGKVEEDSLYHIITKYNGMTIWHLPKELYEIINIEEC